MKTVAPILCGAAVFLVFLAPPAETQQAAPTEVDWRSYGADTHNTPTSRSLSWPGVSAPPT
jgi:hypothetical protein